MPTRNTREAVEHRLDPGPRETDSKPDGLAGANRWAGLSLGDLEKLDRWGEEAWWARSDDESLLGDLRAELIRRRATEPAAPRIHP
jgi:hypothetical protein